MVREVMPSFRNTRYACEFASAPSAASVEVTI